MIKFIDIHTHSEKKETDVFLLRNYSYLEWEDDKINSFYSFGIHPWDLEKNNNLFIENFNSLWENKNCLAIGECGLDKAISISLEKQIFLFKKQANVANNLNKPLIIHCVRSWAEIISVYNLIQPQSTWIIHGYNKNLKIANDLFWKRNICLSFGEAILHSENVFETFKECPDDLFFLETDTSDHSIQEIYFQAAKIKNCSVENIQEIVSRNWTRVFNKNILDKNI